MRKEWFGVNFPFIGGLENVLSRQVGTRLIKNDLLQLLLTNSGERVMRSAFGGNLRISVFDQMDDDGLSSIRINIIDQIQIFDNRIDILKLDLEADKANNQLNIKLIARLRDNPSEDISIDFTIPGVNQ